MKDAQYATAFIDTHSKDKWKEKWLGMIQNLGEVRQFRPLYSQKDARYRGDYYMYGYMVDFERGKAKETITIFKGIEQDEISIVGHVIQRTF